MYIFALVEPHRIPLKELNSLMSENVIPGTDLEYLRMAELCPFEFTRHSAALCSTFVELLPCFNQERLFSRNFLVKAYERILHFTF